MDVGRFGLFCGSRELDVGRERGAKCSQRPEPGPLCLFGRGLLAVVVGWSHG